MRIKNKLSELQDDNARAEYIKNSSNTLTKNIIANIVGVIYCIIKNYSDIAEVFTESEKEAFIIDHEMRGTSITRQFPIALLRKLQKLELTPPITNRQYLERQYRMHEEQKEITMRSGALNFVIADGTSILCPVCMNIRESKKAVCEKCGFDLI